MSPVLLMRYIDAMEQRVMDYMKDRYEEELGRFTHFEGKSSRLMTYLTVIMGALVFIVKSAIASNFTPVSALDWAIVISFCLVFFLLACSWGHSLLVIKVAGSANLARETVTFEYMKSAPLEDLEDYMYRCYRDTIELLIKDVDMKSTNITFAYEELVCGAWASAILLILIVIRWLG
ncbi:hypothetical protein [Thalassolituus sp. UBA2009]|uniref:hypothetical protein n=1 Tax=Thalassolituus sp. UBA2009 TaxID=1947658 RepID=UPI00257D4D9C|nr:hypothetical protein [Thalassolituus sp. UBA2009]